MAISEVDFYQQVRPHTGHSKSGDRIVFHQSNSYIKLAIIDVVGHGHAAHQVALLAEQQLERYFMEDLATTLTKLDNSLTGSLGAAVGLCVINKENSQLSYCGIGNTTARRVGANEAHLLSLDGTVGLYMRTPKIFRIDLEKGDLLIFHSDGISSRYTNADYLWPQTHRAKTVVETLMSRFGKQHDDASCAALVIKS